MKRILKKLIGKISGKDEEKRIDVFISILERNKIKNSDAYIDEVVAFSKEQKLKHDLYI